MRLIATRKLVLLATLTALCLGIQLTPRPPNVEFTSLVVFLVGSVFGIIPGATLGVLVMSINGFFSPYGFAGLILPFQITGMAIVGIGGGMYRRSRNGVFCAESSVETAILGAFLTLVYDLITNFGMAAFFMLTGMAIQHAFISAIISGAPMSIVHVVSNTIVFGLVFFPLINALLRLLGGGKTWKKETLLT